MKKSRSEDGIIKFTYGNMIPTDTMGSNAFISVDEESHFATVDEADQKLQLNFTLSDTEVVYGLGQNTRGMNKRGFVYESFCTDDPNHTPDKSSLYGAHNFLIVDGQSPWGLYIDFAGKVTYDVAFKAQNQLNITIDGLDADVYYFTGSIETIVRQFRSLIGLSYTPPKWAFGYQQSRWSYENHERVREIAQGFIDNDIPCDAIYLDIDYMERFKDFTVSHERFPDFKEFVGELKNKGFRLIPIIDAGVKIEAGYSVYEEGVKNGYFVTDDKGVPFVAAVWPGKVHFPDFLNAEASKWFGDYYHLLLEQGIEGFWNDMNEPAIFYSETGLKEAIDYVKSKENTNLDIYTFFELKDKMMRLSNSIKDYKSMYHKMTTPEGELKLNHYDVHNLYGYHMTRSAAEGFERYDADKRHLLITRASHIGMAKHSGIWTGDNHSWWEHLKLNVQMMPALNMAGFLYSGADTGGFGGNVSAELLIRWMQFSLFTPLLRNHSAMGTRVQEPWAFEPETTQVLRNIIRMRYAMVPYLYSEYLKANLEKRLLFAPLALDYRDEDAKAVEDQLLFGEGLMLAPVMEQNARGRHAYVPERMAFWRFEKFEDMNAFEVEMMDTGHHYLKLPLNQTGVFIRPDKLFVMCAPEKNVDSLDLTRLTVVGYVKKSATYTLFDDDGVTNAFAKGDVKRTDIRVEKLDENYSIHVDTNDHALKKLTFYLIDDQGNTHIIVQNEVRRSDALV